MGENLAGAIAYVNRKTEQFVKENGAPGVGIAIASSTSVLFQMGYGIEDLETSSHYTTTTTILLASVSKVVSGTLLCVLQKENRSKRT